MVVACSNFAALDCNWQGCLESGQSWMLVTLDRQAMSFASSTLPAVCDSKAGMPHCLVAGQDS